MVSWACVWVCVLLESVVFMCFSNGTLPLWTCWGPGSLNAWISSSTSTSSRSSSGSQRWDQKHPVLVKCPEISGAPSWQISFRPAEKVQRLPSTGCLGLHPEQQDVRDGAQQADRGGGHCFSEGRRHAGHLDEGQRRGGWRGLEAAHRPPSPSVCPKPPVSPFHPPPFHTFDFSLVTDACTNSDSHSRTSLSARLASEGT